MKRLNYLSEVDYARYQELLAMAVEAKANAPKPARAPRKPLTKEQKIAAQQKKLEKAQKLLDEMLAAKAAPVPANPTEV